MRLPLFAARSRMREKEKCHLFLHGLVRRRRQTCCCRQHFQCPAFDRCVALRSLSRPRIEVLRHCHCSWLVHRVHLPEPANSPSAQAITLNFLSLVCLYWLQSLNSLYSALVLLEIGSGASEYHNYLSTSPHSGVSTTKGCTLSALSSGFFCCPCYLQQSPKRSKRFWRTSASDMRKRQWSDY